jgi:hypothetical protein
VENSLGNSMSLGDIFKPYYKLLYEAYTFMIPIGVGLILFFCLLEITMLVHVTAMKGSVRF